jgi:hypothetical protein
MLSILPSCLISNLTLLLLLYQKCFSNLQISSVSHPFMARHLSTTTMNVCLLLAVLPPSLHSICNSHIAPLLSVQSINLLANTPVYTFDIVYNNEIPVQFSGFSLSPSPCILRVTHSSSSLLRHPLCHIMQRWPTRTASRAAL